MNVTIDGIKVNYTVKGEGEFVLLLHGWESNIKLFDGLINLISRKYFVAAVDLPGFGESGEPPVAWSVSDYVDFVVKFLRNFKFDKLIVLGHSLGGRLTIKMANRNDLPFKLDKIILTGSAGIMPKRSLKYKVKVAFYKIMKKILMPFPKLLEKYKKNKGSADYANASPIMRQCLVKIVNEDLTPLLVGVKASTLLIWGENDTETPLSDGKLMEKNMPDAGLAVIKNAGHYAFLEQPHIFGEIIKSFLNIGD